MAEASLAGKVALVTGSSRNLGAEIAREMARRGATVLVNYRSARTKAEELVAELGGLGGSKHSAIGADLSDPESMETLARTALERHGAIDILVNNAGPFSMTPYAEMDPGEWDSIWDSNVKSAFVLTRMLAPRMREKGWGRIVNVSAGSAYIRNHSIYTLAKSALIVLTEELAFELGPEVNVNAVAPGQIAESADDIAEFDPSFVERAIDWAPAKRLAKRAEVAHIVADLCGPAYDSVTGVTIPIDGGWRLARF